MNKIEKWINKHKAEFIFHAKQEFPKEACGVLVIKNKRTSFIPCTNVHPCPHEAFECSEEAYKLEDKGFTILAVFHSHTNGNKHLTETDKISMNSCQLPYIMCSLPSEEFDWLEPTVEETPYKGRTYVGGIQDCYTLVRDYYRVEKQVILKDFSRCDRWWDRGMDVLTNENFREAGFVKVALQEIEIGDVIVMQMGKKNDHLGIYLGNQRFLHHCYNRLSCEDVYGGVWLKHTTSIQRYIGEEDE